MESPPLQAAPATILEEQANTAKRPGPFRNVTSHWADYMYVLPALLVMLLVIGYPLVYTIYLSFFETPPSTGGRIFNGIDNYTTLLRSERFWRIARNTFHWTIWSTLFAFLIGFLPGFALVLGGIALWATSGFAGAVLIALGVIVIAFAMIVQTAISVIFGVALYRYATADEVVGTFTAEDFEATIAGGRRGGIGGLGGPASSGGTI